MADPKLYNVDGGRDLAKEINAIVNRDRGISSASAPIVHTGFNSTNYIYTAKNVGTGGKVASWLTSAGATLLDAKDTGVTIGVNLTLPFMTQGSVIFAGAGGVLGQDNAMLFYDDTNNRLGIGTATPLTPLHVVGAANVTDVIRAQGNVGTGMTGAGVELQYNSAGPLGAVIAYNRSSSTYLNMQMDGLLTLMCAAGTAQFTVAATGATVANLLTLNSGQVKFPASQNASSDANTLDDYEESTWTPTDASGASLSFTTSGTTYTKIGRVVIVQGLITYPVTASGASAIIGGLPFTVANYGYAAFGSDEATMLYLQTNAGTTQLVPRGAGLALLTNAALSGNTIVVTAVYQV